MSNDDEFRPRDHAEEVAVFRHGVIGSVARCVLSHGALRSALRELSERRFCPPGVEGTRTFGYSTLERWLYAYRKGGLAALRPTPRRDRGRARELTEPQRALLLDVRREHPAATAAVILRELVASGRIDAGAVSEATVRRLYTAHGLDRVAARDGAGVTTRLRWEAERPGVLWHGDVCHGATLALGDRKVPVRIHGMLDDASRYVVALEAHATEREVDMIGVLVGALRRHGPPEVIYLDNGSTYRGDRPPKLGHTSPLASGWQRRVGDEATGFVAMCFKEVEPVTLRSGTRRSPFPTRTPVSARLHSGRALAKRGWDKRGPPTRGCLAENSNPA